MRTNALTKVLMVAVGLWALPALPGPDTYLVGNGQDGARNIGGGPGGTVINNYAQVLAPVAPGDMTIKTSLATGTSETPPILDFSGPRGGNDTEGDLVLIIQTTGVVPVTVPGNSGPIYLEGGAVGRWELARLTNVTTDEEEEELTLTLDRPLKHSYAAEVTQVVRVPEFTTLTVSANAKVRAKAWDPESRIGGILAFVANGAVTLNSGSELSAEGAGFRGGKYEADTAVNGQTPYVGCPVGSDPIETKARSGEGIDVTHPNARGVENVANGGGGGVCVRAGGGGGGNAGAGGWGGNASDGGRQVARGAGGAALSFSPLTHLLIGGGGGAGHGRSGSAASDGGHGGGIIFVRARSVGGTGGAFNASGHVGGRNVEEGAGGGGAGGTIYVRTVAQVACGAANYLNAGGSAGGDTNDADSALRGPGGGGGGGRILVQATSANACAVSVNVANGVAGNAVDGSRFDATPANNAFPHTGIATLMHSALAAPGEPEIVPATNVTTNNPLPTLTGTGVPGSEVVIYELVAGRVTGPEYGRAAVGTTAGAASFAVTLNRALRTGNTTLVAVTEAQGIQGEESNPVNYTVDTTAPDTHFTANGTPASPSRFSAETFQFASNETSGVTFQCILQEGTVTAPPAVNSPDWQDGSCSAAGSHTAAPLADGETYTFWVRAKDAAQNVDTTPARHVWRVDLSRPNTRFAAGGTPRSDFNEAVALFRFESDESPVTYECILASPQELDRPAESDNRWAPCSNPYFTSARGDGSTNSLWVRAKDEAGNVDDAPPGHPWRVDLTQPDTRLTGTLPAAVNNADSVVFTFQSEPVGDASDFECSLNGAGFDDCESGDSFPTPGDDAAYTFLVRARDAAGNVDPTPATHSWWKDKIRPTTTLTASVGTLSNAPRAGFEFDSNESPVTFQCVLDESATTQAPAEGSSQWQDCAASYLTRVLTDGTYTLWARAKDVAGNVDNNPRHHTWTVDLTQPDTRLTGTLPAAVNNADSVVFTFQSEPVGDASDFECSLNGVDFDECESGDSFPTPDEDAAYTFLVRARDAAGNVDPTPATHSWWKDKIRPTTTLTASVGTLSNAPRAGFEFDSNESPVTFQCVLDESATTQAPAEGSSQWQDCAASYLTRVLTDGTYTLWARAKDVAGNVDNNPRHHTWTVDLTQPDTRLTGTLPAAVNNADSVVFTFQSEPVGDASDFECSLNGVDFDECESGDSFPTPDEDAAYTFLVRARDAAGNVDPTPATHSWRKDKIRPDTILNTTVGTLSNALQALFTFSSVADDVVGYQCVLDSSPPPVPEAPAEVSPLWVDCAYSYLTPPLQDGDYRLWVRARDAAGNVDNDPRHHDWTVDRTPPETQIDSKPAILTNKLVATFEFSSVEPGVQFECSYDGSDYFSCVSPYGLPNDQYPLISEGEHQFLVRAIDAAGNRDLIPAAHSWSVAVGEVMTFIEAVMLGEFTQETIARFKFSSNLSNVVYTCELDGVVVQNCATSANPERMFDSLSEGSHTLSVFAAEGEFRDLSPDLFTWTVDLTPPVVPNITSPAADGMYIKERSPFFQGLVPNDDSLKAGTVDVYRGTQLVHSVVIEGAGSVWSFTHPVALPDGEHTLLFSFKDRAGNVGPTTSRFFIIDAIKPVTTLTVKPNGLTNQPQATFEFASNEEGSTFACSLNGSDFSACTPPYSVSVGDATHLFSVRAIDRAGNVADEAGTHTWRVDTVEPSTSIVEKPVVDTNAPQADFRFESNEAPIWFECSLDGAPFADCSSPYPVNELAEGEHRLAVRARDEATNVDTTPEVYVWRVDMTPPLAPEITAPAPDGVVGSLTPTFQGSAEPRSQVVLFIDGVERGVAPVEPSGQWRLTLTTAISEGPHTVSALARDAAQNMGPESQASSFTVDPSINIIRRVSSRGGGLSCAAGGEGHVPLMLLGWAGWVLLAARRRRV